MKFMYYVYCLCTLAIFLISSNPTQAQTVNQEKMGQLSFMVGNWVGTSNSYQGDSLISQIPAFEKISYKLEQSIITIDLFSESLQLHTVIYYDEDKEKYFYNSYYKNGAGKYEAEFVEDRLIVWASESKRFIFRPTSKGRFQEYGEKLVNGKWVKYFEDNFTRLEE